jgi:hypothetical protein
MGTIETVTRHRDNAALEFAANRVKDLDGLLN